MKQLKTLSAALIIAATAMGAAQAQDNEAPEIVEPAVSFVQAVDIASGTGNGEIYEMVLDYAGDQPVYVASLSNETSITTLVIDGLEGTLMATEKTEAKDGETLALYLNEFSEAARLADSMDFLADFDLEDLEDDVDLDVLESCIDDMQHAE